MVGVELGSEGSCRFTDFPSVRSCRATNHTCPWQHDIAIQRKKIVHISFHISDDKSSAAR